MKVRDTLSLGIFLLSLFLVNCKPNPGIVSLNGEWEYTSGHHTDPAAWDKLEWKKIQVPFSQVKEISEDGWVTLKRTLPKEAETLFAGEEPIAFRSDFLIADQMEFHINGRLLFREGTAEKSTWGNSVLTSLPDPIKKQKSPIIISAAFHKTADIPYREWPTLNNKIGISKEIFTDYYIGEIITFSLLSIYFLTGLYHLLLYFKRRKDFHNLLFGLLCVIITFYWFCRNPSRDILFRNNGFWEYKIEIFILFFIPVLAFSFSSYIFEGKINSFIKFPFYLMLCLELGTLSASNIIFLQKVLFIWQIMLIPSILYILGYVIFFAVKKNTDAIRMLSGAIAITFGSAYDIWAGQGFAPTLNALQYCFPMLILNIAVILANKYVKAFNESDRLNEELSEKNAVLARADKMKDEFLANTSHELRTPLNGIIGLAESNLFDPKDSIQIQKNSEMIISSGRRLSSLVNDILDFSKLKNAEILLKNNAIDVKKIAELVTTLSLPLAKARGLSLSVEISDDLPLANADEDRLQQILINLVGNGIKFTHSGGVKILAEKQEKSIQIIVQDTGIGIPKEKQSIIFESFEQADGSIGREYGGTGLGLSIVRSLVRLHGSEITVKSDEGQGSAFSFNLPIADSSLRLASSHSENVDSGIGISAFNPVIGKVRPQSSDSGDSGEGSNETSNILNNAFKNFLVLVVDDEPVNVMVLENHLKSAGLSVETASDGFIALDKMKTIRPDCILLDLMMPRISGLEVLKKVRETIPPTLLPIVILSAKNQVNDLVTALEAGANDYLTKPFSRNELLARMQVHLDLQTSVKEQIKQAQSFERFVPSKFISLLEKKSVSDIRRGDSKLKKMSVLFTDIRSFTSFSEKMSPEENFKFLNSYLKRMEPAITRHGGFVDKFIGDAVMALFEEHTDDSSADRALAAAIDMKRSLALFNKYRIEAGYFPIEIGIGINYGSLVLGTVGSSNRLSTTVIGNTVNLAARLETLTSYYKSGILISDYIVMALKTMTDVKMREIGSVQVKGKKEPVGIFEVYETDSAETAELKEQTKGTLLTGIIQFKIGEFAAAMELFQEILSVYPEDIVAKTYLSRCGEMIKYPVPENWEGILEFTHK